MLLFYSIPRRDTNELAHELINRFGSLANVFDAPFEALMHVDGVGERTASLIKLIPAIFGEYHQSRCETKATVRTRADAVEFLTPYFADMSSESALMVSLDGAGRVINTVRVKGGTSDEVSLDLNAVFFEILSNSPAAVLLSHCHPRGLAAPSQSDIRTTEKFSDMLSGFDVKLCDHIIFARDDVFCMSRMKSRIRPGIFAFTE
ncbi:MAG: RadC family protein [Oscillospiraceae bacterium]|nr:RadC family protein [Oscillospiraceae bacterium]